MNGRASGIHLISVLILLAASVALAAPPPNDQCANATVVGSLPYTNTVSTTEATGSGALCSFLGDGPRSVWYSFTPPTSMNVTVRAVGGEDIAVKSACDDGEVALYCDHYNATGGICGTTPILAFPAVAGQTYLIGVTGLSANLTFRVYGCGDGALRPQEAGHCVGEELCDDGNSSDGDGCSSTCQVETCWTCSGTPASCSAQTGPACPDDGNSCTTDVCSAGTCSHPNRPDGTSCPTSNPCTSGATCQTGVCERLDETCVPGFCGTSGPCVVSTAKTLANGSVLDLGGRELHVTSTGSVDGFGDAFAFENVGPVTLDPGGALRTNVAGGGARSIQIDSSSACTVNGIIQANGLRGGGTSGDGGAIRLSCDQITIGATGVLEAYGQGKGLDVGRAGSILLDAGSGSVATVAKSKMRATGEGGTGGTIDVSATGDCEIGGSMQVQSRSVPVPDDVANGGDGGTFSISCANVHLGPKSVLTAGNQKEALGGKIEIEAQGDLTIDKGSRLTNFGDGYNPNRAISLSAGGACTLGNALKPAGNHPRMRIACGSLDLTSAFKVSSSKATEATFDAAIAGPCVVAGDITHKGGKYIDGGAVTIDCDGDLTQTKTSTLDVSCSNDGETGQIRLRSGGALSVAGKVLAKAKGYSAFFHTGLVELRGHGVTTLPKSKVEGNGGGNGIQIVSKNAADQVAGDVDIGGTVDGSSDHVSIEGCDVLVGATGTVKNVAKAAGVNTLIAHEGLTIAGPILAVSKDPLATPGQNQLSYRSSVSLADPALVVPATTPQQDASLSVCP